MRISIAILIGLASCAHVQPASMPASEPWFVELTSGQPAPGDGYFGSESSVKEMLKAHSVHDLGMQEQLEHERLLRTADDKALATRDFCSKWCLPLGGIGGLILGVFVGLAPTFAHGGK